MTDISRYARRSSRPVLLGLSTLDTVSCALGGAIILMILMSSFVEPGAEIEITEYREIYQTGAGTPGPTPPGTENGTDTGEGQTSQIANLATLFLDFQGDGTSTKGLEPTLVPSTGCKDSRVSILKPPERHYPSEHADRRWALVVWADTDCESFTLKFELETVPTACTATLVSGAHFDVKSFRPCRPRFELRGSGKQVYVFRGKP